jgi:hypothetical protein
MTWCTGAMILAGVMGLGALGGLAGIVLATVKGIRETERDQEGE